MKKNYNQPMVEAVEVQATSMLMEVSPGALQNSGSGTDTIEEEIVIGG